MTHCFAIMCQSTKDVFVSFIWQVNGTIQLVQTYPVRPSRFKIWYQTNCRRTYIYFLSDFSVLTVATKVKKKIKMLGLWFRNEMYLCQSSFQIWCLSLKECHWHGMNLHNVNVSWVNTYNADYGTCSIKLPTHCWRLWSAAAHPNLSLGINHFG